MSDQIEPVVPVEENIPTGEPPDYSQLSPAEITRLTRAALEAPLQEDAPEPEPVAQVDPPEPEEVIPPDEPEEGKRIRLKGPELKFASLVKDGVSPEEAYRVAYNATAAANPEQTPPPKENPEEALESIESINDELTKLHLQWKQAKTDFDVDQEIELTEKIDALRDRRLEVKELQKQQSAKAEENRASVYDQHLAAVLKEFPEYEDDNSERSRRAAIIRETLQAAGSPIIEADDYPTQLHELVEKSFKAAPPVAPPPAPVKAPATKPAPIQKAQPLAGKPAQPAPPITVEQWRDLPASERNRISREVLARGV